MTASVCSPEVRNLFFLPMDQKAVCVCHNQAWDVSVTQSLETSAILTLCYKRVCGFTGRFRFLRIDRLRSLTSNQISEVCAWRNQVWDVSVYPSCFSSAILTLNCKRVCAFNGRFGFLRIGFLSLQCVTLADLPRKQRSTASSNQNNETLRRGPVDRLPRVS